MGFSLIEVVLAIGIASFVLVGLLGLMSVGLQAGKASHDDTMIAAISNAAFSEWRTGTNNFSVSSITTNYYTYDAKKLESAGPSAYFECTVLNTNHVIALPGMNNAANVRRVRLELSWPASASETSRDRKIFETTVAKYD